MNAVTPAIEAAILGTPVPPQPVPKVDRLHIRVEEGNVPALDAALAEVQPRKGQNNLTGPRLRHIAAEAEDFMEMLGLPKRARRGATYAFALPGAEAAAYRSAIPTTKAMFRRDARGWVLTDLFRIDQWPRAPRIADALLTEEQAALLTGRLAGGRRFRKKAGGPFKLALSAR